MVFEHENWVRVIFGHETHQTWSNPAGFNLIDWIVKWKNHCKIKNFILHFYFLKLFKIRMWKTNYISFLCINKILLFSIYSLANVSVRGIERDAGQTQRVLGIRSRLRSARARRIASVVEARARPILASKSKTERRRSEWAIKREREIAQER